MKRGGRWFSSLTILMLALIFSGAGHSVSGPYDGQKGSASEVKSKLSLKARTDNLQAPYREGEVLVRLREGAGIRALSSFRSQGVSIAKEFRTLSRMKGKRYLLLKSNTLTTQELINILRKDPNVELVSPNYIYRAFAVPNDPRFGDLWGLNNTGQTGGTPDADIDAPEAWNTTTGSSSVVIAVIDTGVDYTHEDLAANMWVNPGENCTNGIDDDGNGYVDDCYGIDTANNDSDPMDDNGHGTHVAGTIAAVGNNGVGVTGVNWSAKIMALKFLAADGSGSTAGAIECIEYAVNMKIKGVNVVAINASWGGPNFDPLLRDAIAAAGDAGILFVAAAGNEGNDNDSTPSYPASYDLPNIISVAATDHNDQLATFSNYGATSVDLAAPGVDILSTVPGYNPQPGDIFFDDMESGSWNWVTGGTNNSWAIVSTDSYSPTQSWHDSPGGNYLNNTNSWLAVSSDIDLSGTSGQFVYLGFWAKVDLEPGWDYLRVEFSSDGGVTWNTIASISEQNTSWKLYSFYIPETYRTANFRFRFRLESDSSITYDGVYIDNVGIGTGSNSYAYYSGTSMATPHVTGVVGLLAAQYPSETAIDRKTRVLAGVDVIPSLSGKVLTGGRLNANNSLQLASLPPYVEQVNPSRGIEANAQITVSGLRFGTTQGRVVFEDSAGNQTDAQIISWSDTQITANVPNAGSLGKFVKVIDSSGRASIEPVPVTAWSLKSSSLIETFSSAAVGYNGKIYRFGGYTNTGTTNAVEVYDPSTDSWAYLAPMPTSRANLTAAEAGGIIYVIGGYDGTNNLNTVEAYNPSTNTWTLKAPLPEALSFAKAVSLNGRVYVTGGLNGNNARNVLYEYNPAKNTWTQRAGMTTARFEHGAVAVNGKIYVFGGATLDNLGNLVYLSSGEVYDPATDTWSPIADMPIPLARMGATTDGRYIYVVGGTNADWWFGQLPVFLVYDTETNTWSYIDGDIRELLVPKLAGALVHLPERRSLYLVNGLAASGASSELEFLPVNTVTLTVTKTGTGSGTVTATGCTLYWTGNTGTCTVNEGTTITLSAAAGPGSTFDGWSSGTGSAASCTGTADCTFTITQNSSVVAKFTFTGGGGGTGGGCSLSPLAHAGNIIPWLMPFLLVLVRRLISGQG